jgi:hypothetical protein
MFRPINRTIGLSPKIGSLALYQILPFGTYAATAYYLKEILGFSWLAYAVVVSLMTGATFLLLGDKPWLFFSRTMEVPYLVRGGTLYQPLLREEGEGHSPPLPHSPLPSNKAIFLI